MKQKFKKSHFLVGQKAIIVDNLKNILLLRRSKKSPTPGRWDFVGGGLEENESPITGIIREIKEESGLNIKDIKPIEISSHQEGEDAVILIFYKAKTKSKSVKLSWEHDEYMWVTKKKALLLNIPKKMKEIIKLI